jgi:hypothetical protein
VTSSNHHANIDCIDLPDQASFNIKQTQHNNDADYLISGAIESHSTLIEQFSDQSCTIQLSSQLPAIYCIVKMNDEREVLFSSNCNQDETNVIEISYFYPNNPNGHNVCPYNAIKRPPQQHLFDQGRLCQQYTEIKISSSSSSSSSSSTGIFHHNDSSSSSSHHKLISSSSSSHQSHHNSSSSNHRHISSSSSSKHNSSSSSSSSSSTGTHYFSSSSWSNFSSSTGPSQFLQEVTNSNPALIAAAICSVIGLLFIIGCCVYYYKREKYKRLQARYQGRLGERFPLMANMP